MFKKIDEWQPVDDLILEDNALEAVKLNNINSLVVAGPGSGKTELLAQRASFLLETNECQYPKKILAISFKRDAAKNLGERVKSRCGVQLSNRFVSKTYDSFAKNLLDHFRKAVPENYRPTSDYNIIFNSRDFEVFFRNVNENILRSNKVNDLVEDMLKERLPINARNGFPIFFNNTWLMMTANARRSSLNFPMITRLAEYIINSNPLLKQYLQATYSHVFLDEFQDTTFVQYDLVKSCFLDECGQFRTTLRY